MKRIRIVAALSAAALLLTITGCTASSDKPVDTAKTQASLGTLKIASMLAFPPFNETVDGKAAGFEVDMINSISKELGYSDIEWIVSDFPGIIPNVAAHKVDMAAAGVTGWAEKGTPTFDVVTKRIEQVSFTRPYYVQSAVLVSNSKKLTSLDQLKPGMKVAVEQASQYYTWANNNLAPKGIEIVAGPQAGLYSQLDAGLVDALIDGTASSAAALAKKPGLVIGDDIPGTSGGFCFVVAKDNTKLLNTLNDAVTKYIKDGSYAKLYEKYFPGTKVPELPSNNFAG